MTLEIVLVIWCAVLLLFLVDVSKRGLADRRLINAQEKMIVDLATRLARTEGHLEGLDEHVARIHAVVDELDPTEIRESLAQKERALDNWLRQAIVRIDNGIATARGLGQTAGESAARDLIRQCIDRAMSGKGPPMQILREGQRRVILGKLLENES